MSEVSDPVGTIRREPHSFGRGDEAGYTIWVLVDAPSGPVWIRVESTNWNYGWKFNDNFAEVVGVVPGSEADRQRQAREEQV